MGVTRSTEPCKKGLWVRYLWSFRCCKVSYSSLLCSLSFSGSLLFVGSTLLSSACTPCTSWWAQPVVCAQTEPGVISGKHKSVALRGWEPAKEELGAPPLPSSPCRKLTGSLLGCHPLGDTASRTNRGDVTSLSCPPSQ